MNLWAIFITGLTVGGLTCLAVQGGLLASVVAARENDPQGSNKYAALFSTAVFLVAKFLAYTSLGFVLGTFGGAININGKLQTVMQLVAGIYMLAVAGNLLNIHPIFRYAIIQPPRFLTRLVRNQSKSKDIFAPAILGLMTIFIPCGTTLAMEVLAISSASGISGALVMAAFVLGTIPLFTGIGVVTTLLGDTYRTKFFKLAAVLVIYLGVTSIYGAMVALGFSFSFQRSPTAQTGGKLYSSQTDSQVIEISITSNGYAPNYLTVREGIPVTLRLTSRDAYSCASAFRIPSIGISRNLKPNESTTISFTPTGKGRIPFSCAMGMYRGVIEVL
jgi:sulfite exporter TauE/SafE